MDNALCGPSNPLQQFQKHIGVDRTLQQDRLASHRSPAENFRSTSGRNAGVLDPEFEAFQAGASPFPQAHDPSFALNDGPLQQPPGVAEAPDWAVDFQRLHLSQSVPIPPDQFRSHAPLQRSAPGGWHQDFRRQHEHPAPQKGQSQPQTYHAASPQMLGTRPFGPHGMASPQAYNGVVMSNARAELEPMKEQGVDTFDEAAFEQAFEQARSEAQAHEDALRSEVEAAAASNLREAAADPLAQQHTDTTSETIRIGADTIEAPTNPLSRRQMAEQSAHESDELSRTAGQLLDSVKDDQSSKFQESTFLALMRRLRDREVKVVGEKIVEDVPAAASPRVNPEEVMMTGAIMEEDDVLSKYKDLGEGRALGAA